MLTLCSLARRTYSIMYLGTGLHAGAGTKGSMASTDSLYFLQRVPPVRHIKIIFHRPSRLKVCCEVVLC